MNITKRRSMTGESQQNQISAESKSWKQIFVLSKGPANEIASGPKHDSTESFIAQKAQHQ
ncbi:hypothetical protein [Rubripirellula lacrimiformis]|nr:hypothetical protein [Rubripirellula lacrimiformis]